MPPGRGIGVWWFFAPRVLSSHSFYNPTSLLLATTCLLCPRSEREFGNSWCQGLLHSLSHPSSSPFAGGGIDVEISNWLFPDLHHLFWFIYRLADVWGKNATIPGTISVILSILPRRVVWFTAIGESGVIRSAIRSFLLLLPFLWRF